ncbi:murein DD-endopeptidase MepM/ murein hydrolase activator NlpD [Croceifilum oryzae]|uniref:Murein DD-endopeptidase MepM/ murein hydrolase activator NlpD n=1 Tax=Croceifilum oryzae TaxID=1553429 RepID=A0AAJ1TKM8_9BACL|nr:M23 family metallopeptidase [Croceifilum oryzae]MDQ0416340.1 murein DD-endopeptidase MepM/ murein hydrolase activator NlpD [Croceifilum oryzae]
MKRPSIYVAAVLLTIILVLLPTSNYAWLGKFDLGSNSSTTKSTESGDSSKKNEGTSIPAVQQMKSLPSKKISGIMYYPLTNLVQSKLVQAKSKEVDGVVELTVNQDFYQLVRNVPVYMRNGIYHPLTGGDMRWEAKDFWLSESFLEGVFQPSSDSSDANSYAQNKEKILKMNADQMAEYLSFVQTPIKGSKMKKSDSSLPGAPRTYRNGIHEGVDFYTPTIGVPVTKNTPVHSLAEGVIVRVDHDYKEMSTPEREKILAEATTNNGQTPQDLLDRVRGRTVWIQHSNGLLARYIHLSQTEPKLRVGDKIKAGDYIGNVGNSGTSDGAKGNNEGIHLHLDLFLYGEWFWKQYPTLEEKYKILFRMFGQYR